MPTPRRIVSHIRSNLRHAADVVRGLAARTWDWLFNSEQESFGRSRSVVRLRLEQLEDRTCPDAANPNAPILDSIANQSDFENDTIQLAVNATDPNQDAITYSAANLPPGLSINTTTGVISGTIDYSAATQQGDGVFNSSVTATDSTSLTDTKSFTWTVGNVNRPPAFEAVDEQVNIEGDEVELQIVASDLDGETLEYEAENLPAGLTIDSQTGEITGTIEAGAASGGDFGNGLYLSTISVTDGGATESTVIAWQVSAQITLEVVDAEQEVITAPENTEGEEVQLQADASATGNPTFAYSAANLPSGLVINSETGAITGTINAGAATAGDDGEQGYYTSTITVTDGTYAASTILYWSIAPRVAVQLVDSEQNVISYLEGTEGASVDVQAIGNTPDNTTLTYSADTLPDGLSIDSATGEISGTVAIGASTVGDYFPGVYLTTITATDGEYTGTATLLWFISSQITIQFVDEQQNVITSPDNLEGDSVNLEAQVSVPNNAEVTFSAVDLPEGLAIDEETGAITGTIVAGAATAGANVDGKYITVVTVTNGTSTTVAILEWHVSPRIAVQVVDSQEIVVTEMESVENDEIMLLVQAISPDNSDISFAAANLPAGLAIDPETGAISGTITNGAAANGNNPDGSYSTVITATDGSFVAQTTVRWIISSEVLADAPKVDIQRVSLAQYAQEIVDKKADALAMVMKQRFGVDVKNVKNELKDDTGVSASKYDATTRLYKSIAAGSFVRFKATNVPEGEYVLQTIKKTEKVYAADGTLLDTTISYTSEAFSVGEGGLTSVDFHAFGTARFGEMINGKAVAKVELTMEFTVGLGHYQEGELKLGPPDGFTIYGENKESDALWSNLKWVPNTKRSYSVQATMSPSLWSFTDSSTGLKVSKPAIKPPLIGDKFPKMP